MKSAEPDPAEAMRTRLQANLRAAMRARAAFEVAVLRALISAIDNARAVPLSPQSSPPQLEVQRRWLSVDDVQAILERECRARQHAAEEYARLGRAAESEGARRELAIVRRYIGEVTKLPV